MNADPWELMSLPRGAPARDVKRRYAALLKLSRPDVDPDGFQALRWAYEICLAYAGPATVAANDVAEAREVVPAEVATAGAFEARVEIVAATVAPEPLVVALPAAGVPSDADHPHTPPVTASQDEQTGVDAEPDATPDAEPETALASFDLDPPPRDAHAAPPTLPPVAHPWFDLDRLDVLRNPADVVDELLAHAAPANAVRGRFAEWFAQCPELTNFALREAIERELLERLVTRGAQLSDEAFSTLEQSFAWSQIGFERRLIRLGLSPSTVECVVDALEHSRVEAQFVSHLAGRTTLLQRRRDTQQRILGDSDGERAELRRMRAERERPQRRWLRAVRISNVDIVNQLFYAYATRFGAAAVDHLFGADAVKFWNRAHPGNPPNAVQAGLSALRWLLALGAFGLLASGILATADNPELGLALRNLWMALGTSAVVAVSVTIVWRWIKLVAVPRFARWEAEYRERMAPFLEPRRAVPATALLAIVGTGVALAVGPGWLALGAVILVGFVLGSHAGAGALFLAWFGYGAVQNTFGTNPVALSICTSLIPMAAWLCDHVAARTTAQPDARGRRTFWLLLALALALLVASVVWGPHAIDG